LGGWRKQTLVVLPIHQVRRRQHATNILKSHVPHLTGEAESSWVFDTVRTCRHSATSSKAAGGVAGMAQREVSHDGQVVTDRPHLLLVVHVASCVVVKCRINVDMV